MKNKITTFILLLIFFIGLSILLYPAISNYWNSQTQSEAIVDYEKMLEYIPKKDYSKIFKQADEYNQKLKDLNYPLIDYSSIKGYNDILNINGNGIMGYISIEKIQLELPIYHGTDEEVLNVAVGHLQGTSLPIGGEGTHSVLSAHRGLPSAKLFTNLDRLEIGDTFDITILNRVITYEVDKISIVEPNDTNALTISDGEEYCTLLTCTPYGINTHRLLVRGKRIETTENKQIHIVSEAYQIEPLIIMPIIAIPILFVLMMIVLFKPINKNKMGDDLE